MCSCPFCGKSPVPLIDQTSLRNILLRRLRPEDFALLASHLEPVQLHHGMVLSEPDQPSEHAYFFEHGVGSIIPISTERQMVEAGLFGRDGFWPTSLALGAKRSPYQAIVQIAGEGHRMPLEALCQALAESRPLHDLLLRFAQTLMVQISYTALSNAVQPIEERLARWLLMCHDRSGNEMPLTHEFISIMLAVRRPSVTTALHVLEGNGFIRGTRGAVTMRDRHALEEFAGDGYGRPEGEYKRLIGPLG